MKVGMLMFWFIIFCSQISGQLTISPLVDVPTSDSYAITFTDEPQKEIIVRLSSAAKTSTINSLGWTVKVNGSSVGISSVVAGPVAEQILITLVSSIPYAHKKLVQVSYDNSIGTVTDWTIPVAVKLASFTDHAAVNNKAIDINLLKPARNVGTAYLKECAPVEVEMTFEYAVKQNYRNSIYFDSSQFKCRVWYDAAGTWKGLYVMNEPVTGSGNFNISCPRFTYPDYTDRCRWDPKGYIQVWFRLPDRSLSERLDIASSTQPYVFGNHHTDNIDLAGDFVITPPIGDSNNEYCRGSDILHQFTDNTFFNCNTSVESLKPNLGDRNVRFLYGTSINAGTRIPNVFVRIAAGKEVQITDASGNLLPPPFAWKPDGTPGPFFPTNVYGVFEGPLVTIPSGLISSGATTFEIFHTGDYDNDAVGDIFEVLLQNWNPCNAYPGGSPIQITSYIKIIDAPPAPGVTTPQSYCYNSVPTTISATKNNAADLLNWYDDEFLTPPALQSSLSNTYTHGKVDPGVYEFWVTETGGNGCEGPSSKITLIIREELTKPGTITGPEQVCTNETGVKFSVEDDPPVMTPGGATEYFWTIPTGWSFTAGQGTREITVTAGNAAGPQDITVLTRYTTTPQCATATTNFTTNLNPVVTINSAGTKTVCDVTPLAYTATSATAGCTFAWTRAVVAGIDNAAGSGSTALINESLDNTTTAPVNVAYIITPSINGCPGTPFTLTVTVNPAGQVNDPTDQVVCNGGATTAVTFSTANSGGSTSYAWTNNTTSIGLAASGSGNIGSFTATNTSNAQVTATITVTPTYTNNSVSCTGTAQTFTIKVNPSGQANTPSNQTVCNGSPTTAINFSTTRTDGTTTYSWTNNTTSIGLAASGTGNIASFTAVNTGNARVTATINVTPTYTNGSVSCTGTAKTFYIYVNPTGQVNQPSNLVVCQGNTAAVTFTTTTTGGTRTYAWTNTNIDIGLGASGTGNISFTAANTGDSPISGTIEVTPTYANGGVSCPGPSKTFTITVNPVGQVNDPSDQVVCNGASTAAVTFATTRSGGTTTYAWTNNTTSIGLAASGSTNIASFTATNTTSAPVTATITVTPTFTNGSTSCLGTAQAFTITVNPTGQVTQPSDLTVCQGSAGAVTFATTNTGGTTTYAWTNSNASIGLPASGSGNLSFTAANTGNSPISGTIDVTPTFTNGSVSCTGTLKSFTITVNPKGQVNDPSDQILCNGDPTAAVNFTTTRSGGTIAYAWTNNTTSIGLGAGGTGNIPSFTAGNTGSSPVTATITVTSTFTNNSVGCTGTAQTFTIIVNPSGQVTQPSNQTVCKGDATSVTFATTNTGGSTTYAWTNTNTNIGLGASGSGNISFTAANATTGPITGTIQVIPTFTNGGKSCSGPSKSFTITVNPKAVINSASTKTVCSNEALGYTATSSTSGATFAWSRAVVPGISNTAGSGSTSFINESLINTTGSNVDAIYLITPSYGSCPGTTFTLTVTVHPQFTVAQLHDDISICNNTATNFNIVLTGGTSPYTINYNKNGTPQTALSSYVSGTDVTTGLLTTGSYEYELTSVTDFYGCPVQSTGTKITVTVGTLLSAASLVKSPDVCDGTSSWIKSAITGGAPPYIINYTKDGVPQTEVDPYTSNTNIDVGVLAVGSYVFAITSVEDLCGNFVPGPGLPSSVTIKVDAIPSAAATSNSSPTICYDGTTNIVLHSTVSGSDFLWTVSNSPAVTWQSGKAPAGGTQLAGEGLSIAQNLAHDGTSPVTVSYKITPRGPASTNCLGSEITRDVVVNPSAQVNDPSDQTVCNGGATTLVTFGTDRTGGTTTYSWSNDTPSIGLAASGTTSTIPSFTAANTGTAPVTATITVTPTFTNGGKSCSGTAQSFTITVNPSAQVNDPSDQTVCNGGATTLVTFGTDRTGGTTTYSWTNNTTSIGLAASGTSLTIPSFTAANTGSAPVTATITITPTFTNGGKSCSGTAQSFTITVNPSAQVNDPSDQTVCNGGATTLVTFGTDRTGGTTTYSWTNNTTSIGLAASGTSLTIPSFTAANTGSAPVTATITITPTFTNGGKSCSGTAQSFTITVNPSAQVNDPSDQTVCNGGATTLVTFGTDRTGGTTTYSWTNNTTSIGLAASGTSLTIPSFTAANTGSSPVTATITVTPTYTNGVSCSGTAQSFTITVNPTGQVNDPSDQTVCNGGATTLVTFGTDRTGGTTTYSWTNNTTSIGLAASGTSLTIPSFTAANTGSAPVTATITVTPTFTNGGKSCSGTAQSFTITVNPSAQVNDPSDQTVCNGGATTLVTFGTDRTGGTTTYSWTNNTTSIGLAASGTSLTIPSFTAANTGSSPVTATITVTPTYTNGVSCSGTAQSFTITVNPTGQVNDPSDQTVCNGGATTLVTFGTDRTGGTTTYSWSNDTPSIGLAASGTTSTIPSFTAANTGTAPVTATITVTPTFTNGGKSCSGTAQSFTITVNPSAQVNDPSDQTVCNGGATTLVTFGTDRTGGTTTYSWTNNTTSIGLAASGTSLTIPSFTAANTGSAPVTATITITPTFTNGGKSCSGTAQSFTITVNPSAQVNDPSDQTVCNGGATTLVTFGTDRTGGTTTYSWTNNTTSIGLAASGTSLTIPSFTAANTGSSPVTATITVTPTYTNGVSCSGTAQSFTITVNPTGQVNDPSDQTVCNGGATTLVTFGTDRTGGTTTYSWTNNTTSIGLAASGTSLTIPSFTAANTGTAPVTATITVTPTFTNGGKSCSGTAQSFTITVNPTPELSGLLTPADVCSNTVFSYSPASATSGTTFSWSRADIADITPAGTIGTDDISETLVNISSATIPVTYQYTLVANTCSNIQNVIVNIKPEPVITSAQNVPVCSGNAVNYQVLMNNFTDPVADGVTFVWAAPILDPVDPGFTGGSARAFPGSSDDIGDTFTNTLSGTGTATYTITPYKDGCAGSPVDVVITVGSEPVLDPGLDKYGCNNEAIALILKEATGSVVPTHYDILSVTIPSGLTANGSNAAYPASTTLSNYLANDKYTNASTGDINVTYRVRPRVGSDCIGDPVNVTVTIRPPIAAGALTGSTSICYNTDAPVITGAIAGSGGDEAITYNWFYTTTIGAPVGDPSWNLITGAGSTDEDYDPGVLTVPTQYIRRAKDGSCAAEAYSNRITIDINPLPETSDIEGDAIICETAANKVYEVKLPRSGGSTYEWTVPASLSISAPDPANSYFIIVDAEGPSAVGDKITVTETFTSTTGCVGLPVEFYITVSPVVPGDPVSPTPTTVCKDGSKTFSVPDNPGSTYSWSIPPSAFITGDANLHEVLVTFPVAGTGEVSVYETNGACSQFHAGAAVTVYPLPVLSSSLTPPAICSGSTFAYTAESTTSGASFAWSRAAILGITEGGSSGTGNVSEDLTNTTTAPISVTYVYTTTANGCPGPAQYVVVTVNPYGQVNKPADQVICNGSSSAPVGFTSNNTGGITTYTWTNDNTDIGLAGSGSGNISLFTATNTTASPIVANIEVFPHFTNGSVTCDGPSETFTMTVNPKGQVIDPGDQVVCNGLSTAAVTFATDNIGGSTTYTWTNNKTSIGLAANGTGDIAAFAAENTGSSPVIATISVTPHYTFGSVTCDGPVQTFTITVNPTAQVNDPADQLVCNNSSTAVVNFGTTNTGGTTTYSWVNDNTSIGLGVGTTGNIAAFTATNSTTAPIVANITVTPHYTNGGVTCDGPTQTFTITVNPSGQVNDPGDQTVCNGSAVTAVAFTTTNTVGTTTYSWTNNASGIGLAASGTGNISSFTAVNTGTAPVVATISVTPHFTYGSVTCDGPVQNFTITVNPSGQVNDPADQVVCNNTSTAAVNFTSNNTGGTTTYSWTNSIPGIGLLASGTGNIDAFTAVNTGSSPVVATITVTPHFDNGAPICDGPIQTFTITVNPSGQVNNPASQVVCSGSSSTSVIFGTTNTGGTTSYTWTNDNTGIGLGASGSGDLPIFTAVNGGTAPEVANIVVTPHFTNGSVMCEGPTKTFTITVNPKGQVNDPANQVVCNGLTTAGVTFTTTHMVGVTTYSWTNNDTSIGLDPGGSGDIAAFAAVNTGTSPVFATITVTPHFAYGGLTCDGPAENFTITVNPTAQVNDPVNQVVCNGSSVAAVNFTTNNTGGITSYSWDNSASGIGLAASGTGNIASFTAENTGTAPVVATITVTPHFANGGLTCDGPVQTFTITVNPTAQVEDMTNQVVCNGSSTTAVAFSTVNTVGTTTYSWTNSATSIGLAASGTGNIGAFTASNITTAPIIATITVTPHFANGGLTCDGLSKTFTITVNPAGQVNDPANQVVCNGSGTTDVIFTTNNTGGTTTYSWTNNNTTINLGASGTGDILSFVAANTGTLPVVATITVTPHFDNGAPVCDGPVQTFTITVNPAGQVNDPADQVVCNGSSTTTVIFGTSNTGGTTTYTWTNSETGIGLGASGSGNITAFSATNTGASPLVATITVTPHYSNASVSCDGPAESFTITVNPTAQVNDPADQVVCNGLPVAAINFTSTNSGGTTSYTWVNDNTGIGLAASGGGNISSFNGINTGNSPEVATVIVTPHFANGSVTCNGPSQTFYITVNPTGQVNDPADQEVCNGSSTAKVTFNTTNVGGTTTYSWVNDLTSIGLAANGTGNISAFTAVNSGSLPVVANITVTPHFANGSVTCNGPVQTFTITVNPTAQVNDITSQVVCNGSSTDAVSFGTLNTVGTTTYTWTNNATSINLASSGTGDIPVFTAANTGTSPVTATITVTPHFEYGSVTCDGPAKTFTITVNPTARVNDPSDQVVCNGSLTTAVIFATTNTGGTTSYTWSNDNTSIGLGSGTTGDIAAFTATNTTTAPVVANITVTPQYTNGGETCSGTPQTFTITVNPSGQVDDPGDQELCNGEATAIVAFTTANSGGTTTYSWTNNTTSIGLAAGGNGNIPSFTVSNITSAPVVATITVTPHFTNSSVTCDGTAVTFTITVNPSAQVNDPVNQVVCHNSPVTDVIFTTLNTVGTTSYSWVNSNTGIGLGASGTGDILSFTATNTTTAPITGTITVTPAFTNGTVTCTGPVQTFTITVNPAGQVNDPADQVVCNGASTANVIFSTVNTVGTTSYTWTNDNPGIGLGASGSGNIPFFTAENSGTVAEVANIEVTPHFTNGSVGCDGPAQTFIITVNPTAQVNDPADQVVCNGSPVTAVTFTTTNTDGATTYTWTNNETSIGLDPSGTGDIATFNAVNSGTSPVTATIIVTPHYLNASKNCDGPAQTFTIKVNPTPQVNDPDDQVVCNGSSVATVKFTTVNTGGTTTYTWANSAPGIGLAGSGSGNIASFTAGNTGTAPVDAIITVTPHFTSGGLTCDGTPETFTITVNPTAQVNDLTSQVVCNSFETTDVIFTTANTDGTTTYTWTNSASSIGLAASGSGDIPKFAVINTGTSPVVATITVTPHFENGSVTCNGPAKTFTITVNPTAQVNDPANQVICNGISTLVTFTTTNSGGLTTYSWVNDNTSIGLGGTGTDNIGSFTALNTGTSPVTATITVTPHFNNGLPVCDGPAQTFTITVNPTGQVDDLTDQVVCNGAYTAPVIFATGNTGGTTTYSWTNDLTSIGLAASGSGNISAFKAVNTSSAPVTANIEVTPQFTYNSVTCDGTPQTFTITVNPTGQVNDPSDQVVCNGDATTEVVFGTSNTGGTTTYTWTNSATSIGLTASGTGDIASFTALNIGTSPVTATITVTPHFTNGGATCDGPAQTFTITVNPTGQVNDPANQVVCNNSPVTAVNFTTSNTVGITTYTWINDNISISLAANGTGNISAFTATNPGTSPAIATIEVTPHFTNGGVTCDGPVQTFTITVNPTPDVTTISPTTICSTASTNIALTSNVAGAAFSWTIGGVTGGITGASASSGSTIAQILVNSGTTPGTVTYVVTPTANSCSGTPVSIVVTVNPTAQVNDPANQVVCNNTSASVTFATGNSGGLTTYSWVNDNTGIGIGATGTGNIAAFTATNSTTAPIVANITVTPHFENNSVICNGPSQSFTITVNPTGEVNQPTNQVLCNGSSTTAVIFATDNTGGTTTYSWTNDKTSIGLAATGSGNITAFTAVNTGSTPVVATIVVTPTFTNGSVGCAGPAKTFTITVNPTAQVTQPVSQVVCNATGTAAINFATTNTGGTTTFNWTNDKPSIGLAATGSGNITAFTAVNTGTAPVVATIVVTPTFTNGSVGCAGPAKTFTITVNPTAQVTQPVSQVVCNATGTTAINFATTNTGGTTTYAWTNDKTSIGLAATGSGDIASFTAVNTGTAPVVATIAVTPTFTNGTVSCTGSAKTFTITVNPTGQVTQPVSQVVCNATSITAINFVTTKTGGTTTFNWTNDKPSIGLAATGSGNISAFTAVNTGTAPVVATVVVTPTFTNGSVSCAGPSKTFTITVNPNRTGYSACKPGCM